MLRDIEELNTEEVAALLETNVPVVKTRLHRARSALKKLLETRSKLNELLTKVDLSDDLETLLEQVLQNTDDQKNVASELGVGQTGSSPQGDQE